MIKERLRVAPEVADALREGRPVVAFESTILSFGLPHPDNQDVGLGCEQRARDAGAVPATIAIMEGQICVGISHDELMLLCREPANVRKVNLQNLSAALSQKWTGATTVAATTQACATAGIRLFCTGGIGGVHRGYASVPDISSDLVALSRFPVAVVCSGAKSILDVSATLEALETLGVPVAGLGCDTFPLFHSRVSEHELELRFETVDDVATWLRTHFEIGSTGAVIAVPPPEEEALSRGDVESWIAHAMDEAKNQGITGKRTTPFLLARLAELSSGQTLRVNKALILNNATRAAEIAVALASIS